MGRPLFAVFTLSCLVIAAVNCGYKVSAAGKLKYSQNSIESLIICDEAADSILRIVANPRGAGLNGTSWQLVKFQGSDGTTLTPNDKSKYTITFGKDGRLSARIDCNRGGGTWKASGPNQLQFGPMALTRAMCPPGSLHDQIVKNWSLIRSYIIKDGHLFLSLAADGGIYEFEPIGYSKPSDSKSPVVSNDPIISEAAALGGKKWKLTELRGAAVSTARPYVEFDVKAKRFSGDGGCNRIAGGFEVDGTHIKFSKTISTKRACIDSALQQVETDFLTALSEATEFQIQGDVLRLYKGDLPVLTFRADSTETSGSQQSASVKGTVTYRQRIALTPDAVVEVKLLDVSRADAPAVTIAEQTIKPAGRQVPIAFELHYDPSRIVNRSRYGIQVRILENGQVRFINTQAYPVTIGGEPKKLNVMVNPVPQ